MPVLLDPTAGMPPQSGILLIEEYDALASAIGSALKKFAPRRERLRASSFAEAATMAVLLRPALFVIDLDPPLRDAVGFLARMRANYPDARVLVIASGMSEEVAKDSAGTGAIRFLEKPFELDAFGAAVQALLASSATSTNGGYSGSLLELNARDLIQVECATKMSAVLKLESSGNQTGEIHFADGDICHARANGVQGFNALKEILSWEIATFTESERPSEAPKSIRGSWSGILLDAMRLAKAPGTARVRIVPTPAKITEPPPQKTGHKILIIDDTELLLVFVEEFLSTADPQAQIATAHDAAEGYRRAESGVPDLVLLDYNLPDMKGDEVCRRLGENETTAQIPVIMMSGQVAEMMAAAQRYGNVVATIAKPFLSHALVALVATTLSEGRRPEQRPAKDQEKADETFLPADRPDKPQEQTPELPSEAAEKPIAIEQGQQDKIYHEQLAPKRHVATAESSKEDRILEIIFGSQMREYDYRFQRFEEHLAEKATEVSADVQKRIEALESLIKSRFEAIENRANAEHTERADVMEKLARSLSDVAKNLDSKINQLDEHLATQIRELREQLTAQSKILSEEMRERQDQIKSAIDLEAAQIREAMTGREALGEMLSQAVLRLRNEFHVREDRQACTLCSQPNADLGET